MQKLSNWKQAGLRKIVKLNYGKGLPARARVGGKYDVYGSNGIVGKHGEFFVEHPTIIVGRKGSVGKVNLSLQPCWVIDTAFYTEVIDDKVDLKYLYYFLDFISSKLVIPMGVKPGINRNDYLAESIPLPFKGGEPDLEEQKRIADKIDKLFAEVDKGIEKTKEGLENVENLLQSELKNIVRDLKCSKKAKAQALIDIAEYFSDGDWVERKNQSDSGIRLLQTGNVGIFNFKNNESRKRYISQKTFELLNCKEVFSGDILISRLPEPVGRACIVPKLDTRLITAVDCTIFRPKKRYDVKFVNYLLNSHENIAQVRMFLTGSSRKRISRKNLEKIALNIPFKNNQPDSQEQRRIVKKLDEIQKQSQELQSKYKKQLKHFEMLKQSILNQAFQGKL